VTFKRALLSLQQFLDPMFCSARRIWTGKCLSHPTFRLPFRKSWFSSKKEIFENIVEQQKTTLEQQKPIKTTITFYLPKIQLANLCLLCERRTPNRLESKSSAHWWAASNLQTLDL
jgi:hypothetical protein